MRNGLLTTLLILLCCQQASAAETAYVIDQLRLGVRAQPDMGESSIAVVSTGDALTVLEEDESFIKIRTEGGVEGWVSKGYVSAEPPARLQLNALQVEHQKLQQESTALQQQLKEQQQQYNKLQQQYGELQAQLKVPAPAPGQQPAETTQALAQLQQENAELKARLANVQQSPSLPVQRNVGYLWGGMALLLLASFLFGMIGGVRWKARRVAERIGGLQI